MFELIKLESGALLAFRVWRFLIYVERNDMPTLRHGGCMCTYRGKRVVASHIKGRVCFITDQHLSMVGLSR